MVIVLDGGHIDAVGTNEELLKSNAIYTILSIFVAIAVYGVLLIKLKGMDADELRQMPGGTRLLPVLRKLRLM